MFQSTILALALCILTVPSRAASITYSIMGGFPGSIPDTSVSSAGLSFDLSFTVPDMFSSTPDPASGGFLVTLSSASLMFGSQVAALSLTQLEFFDAAHGGGLLLEGTHAGDDITFALISQQLFSGTLATPVLLNGTFPVDISDVFSFIQLGGSSGVIYRPLGETSIETAIPEPGGLFPLAAVLLLGLRALRHPRRVGAPWVRILRS